MKGSFALRRRPWFRFRAISRLVRKRRKRCDPTCKRSSASDGVVSFERWARNVGIEWDDQAIGIIGNVGSCRVVAKRKLYKGEVILRVPLGVCITIETSYAGKVLLADPIYQRFIKKHDDADDELTHPLPLIMCVLYERALGPRSPFVGYMALLPQKEAGVPFTWPRDKQLMLQGTELAAIVQKKMEDLDEEWRTVVDLLCKSHPLEFPSEYFNFERYVDAASLVISRCFPVTRRSGGMATGMLPFLDLLNHRSDEEMDYSNDACTQTPLEPPVAEMDEDNHTHAALMVMRRVCPRSQEVCQSYGAFSASEKLFRYGFLPLVNTFVPSRDPAKCPVAASQLDFVGISTAMVVEAICAAMSGTISSSCKDRKPQGEVPFSVDDGTESAMWERIEYLRPVFAKAEIIDEFGVFELRECTAHQNQEDGAPQAPVGLLLTISILSFPQRHYNALVQCMHGTRRSLRHPSSSETSQYRYEPDSLIRLVAIVRKQCDLLRASSLARTRAPQEDHANGRATDVISLEQASEAILQFTQGFQVDSDDEDADEATGEEEDEREHDTEESDDEGQSQLDPSSASGTEPKRKSSVIRVSIEDLLANGAEDCLFLPSVGPIMSAVLDRREMRYPTGTTLEADQRRFSQILSRRDGVRQAQDFDHEYAVLYLRILERKILEAAREWVRAKAQT